MTPALTPRIGCVVLAAGGAKRFGSQKLLERFHEKPVLQHAIDAACGAGVLTCTLVLGSRAERVAAGVDTRRCAIALSKDWKRGIAASIGCGLHEHGDDDACIIMLGDQPNVSAADLDALIAGFVEDQQRIVALRAGDVWGAPALFPRRDFAGLRALRGDTGAKRYIQSKLNRLMFVAARRSDAFADVDTKNDLIRLTGS